MFYHSSHCLEMELLVFQPLPPSPYRPVLEDKLMYQQVGHEAIAAVMTRPSDQALWYVNYKSQHNIPTNPDYYTIIQKGVECCVVSTV